MMKTPEDGLFSNNPIPNLPDGGNAQPAKRGPGRPRKNPLTETWPTFAEPSGEARPRPVEPKPKLTSATTTAVVTALAGLLAAGRFEDFGSNPRSLFEYLHDLSPSESEFQREARKAGKGMTEVFQANSAARNRIDVVTLGGAEWCRVLGFAHGAFEMPKGEEGLGTCALPWLEGTEAAAAAWREELAGKGVPTTEGLTVVASDFRIHDGAEVSKELQRWKASMKAMGQVVIAATFGDADPAAAAKFTDLPVVDLHSVPLAALFRVLAVSLSTSLGRPGSLERQVRLDLAALAAGSK